VSTITITPPMLLSTALKVSTITLVV
jgi:hypothetical protein